VGRLRKEEIPGLLARLRRKTAKLPPPEILRWQTEQAGEMGIRILLSGEDEWPPFLNDLHQSPPLLFMRGTLPQDGPMAAIVGSRRCSRAGREMAALLGRGLAGAGVTVISGLARGIDGEAHRGALDGGRTVAVLGGGIDRIYPHEHEALAGDILRRGALLGEFPPGTTPLPFHFPRRNRIIAALAELVIVVEAGERSGARITARHALDLGRTVGVVPGNPMNPVAAGSNQLLFEGASPVLNTQDALELLEWGKAKPESRPWSPERCREEGVGDLEALALRSGWSLARSIETLASWERDGRVRRLSGGRFEVSA